MSDLIRKTFATCVVRSAEGSGPSTIKFVASTPTPDSYSDVVVQDWITDDFVANPVIPWGHDYSQPPVGRAVRLAVEPVAEAGWESPVLVAEVEFDMDDPVAARIAGKYARGFLSAVSVGFVPGEYQPRSALSADDPQYAKSGYIFRKNRLKEISAVTVPANPDALAVRETMGVARGLPAELDIRAELLRLLRTDAELRAEVEALGVLRGVTVSELDPVASLFGLAS